MSRTQRLAAGGVTAGLALWCALAFWIAPALLKLAHEGALPLSDMLLRGRATVPASYYIERWESLSLWLTALGGTAVLMVVERRWIRVPLVSVAGLAIGAFFFHLATIRHGIWYGSDAAYYILHARNLAEGIPYAATGYIQNPTHFHSPATYPPLFPLLLAPIYAVSGLALYPMKVLIVVATVITAVGIHALARRFLPIGPSLLAAWLFAFAPIVRLLKNDVLSDLPFLAAVVLCLWAAESRSTPGDRSDGGWKRGVAVAVLCYFAYATRTIGIVLLPILLFADLVRVRRISRYAVALGLTGVGLIVMQEMLLGSFGGYATRSASSGIVEIIGVMMRQAGAVAPKFSTMMFGGLPRELAHVATAVVVILGLVGLVLMAWRRSSPTALFVLAYPAALLTWPGAQEPRVLLPVMALAPILMWVALREVGRLQPMKTPIIVGYVGLCAVSFALQHRNAPRDALPDDYTAPIHTSLVTFVDRETKPADVFVSIAPRTFALITRRPGSIFDARLSFEEQWQYLQSIDAKYVVMIVTSAQGDSDTRDRTYLTEFIAATPDRLKLAFENERYLVYRIVAAAPPPSIHTDKTKPPEHRVAADFTNDR